MNNNVKISVEWDFETHSVTLGPEVWTRVKSGKPEMVVGEGHRYEGEFFQDYWHFDGE